MRKYVWKNAVLRCVQQEKVVVVMKADHISRAADIKRTERRMFFFFSFSVYHKDVGVRE